MTTDIPHPDASHSAGGRPAARAWKLARLVQAVPGAVVEGTAPAPITSLSYDSRRVQPGGLFVALPGTATDGRLYVDEAVRRGAVAVVHEDAVHGLRGVASVRVQNARAAMGDLAALFYGHPSHQLQVIGVTGTNGKTTTVFMVRDILRAAGLSAGLIGTIHYEFGGRRITAARTTPESIDLQQMLADSLQAGDKAMAMEVSSQGLAAERLRGTRFAAAVFTNLTIDHLDFHQTMEAYFAAKKRLFESLAADSAGAPAVVNLDDAYGRRLAAEPFLAGRVLSYGMDSAASVRGVDIRCAEKASSFCALTPWGECRVELPLAGRFNVSNALAAMAVCGAFGIPVDTMARALGRLPPVPGRLESIEDPRGTRHLFVDYAHTEDALRNVLQTLRETTPGRLLCVFGCGGNRDRAKRPRMGAAVAEFADHAFVTSDNPRGEEPAAILADILAGMDSAKPRTVEADRAAAIRQALGETRDGDTLLVAGKGHETYQEIGGRMVHFDDREVLRQALADGL
jgi:UDP-N-acetylmuramoyl-L-alanyl-D-glutamate--2,6-diaminopimelate ligase